MENKAFAIPQRQSIAGVALIFFTTLFKFLRGFWVIGVYLILKTPTGPTAFYILLGLIVTATVVLIYSYLYYRNFLFHIDYDREEFILQKGVISTENVAIPFDKIQQVYFKRTILERLINVYSVVLDTAGSKNDEVSIKAISKEDADLLSSILTKVKGQNIEKEEVTEEVGEAASSDTWTHKLDVITLLKIGISTNYIRGLAIVLAFFTTLYNELSSFFEDYEEQMGEYYEMVPQPTDSLGFFLILFILLLLVSIVITVFEVFIKYYGLKLIQTRQSLELEMGLKTNTKVAIQPRRVQLMQIITNPVQKRFNLHEIRVALASSEDELGKNRIKIPGLGKEELIKVRSFLFGDDKSNFVQKFHPHRLMLLRRYLIVLFPVIISFILLLWFDYMDPTLWLIAALMFTIIGIIYQYKRYHSLELIFSDEFLQKKQGVWNFRSENFEIFKMQAVTVKQPFWYKRRNLVNLKFHTAGGDVTFKAVNKDVLPYINYLLYKVESSDKRWM